MKKEEKELFVFVLKEELDSSNQGTVIYYDATPLRAWNVHSDNIDKLLGRLGNNITNVAQQVMSQNSIEGAINWLKYGNEWAVISKEPQEETKTFKHGKSTHNYSHILFLASDSEEAQRFAAGVAAGCNYRYLTN